MNRNSPSIANDPGMRASAHHPAVSPQLESIASRLDRARRRRESAVIVFLIALIFLAGAVVGWSAPHILSAF